MPRPLAEYQENVAAEMLEDLSRITGIPLDEIISSGMAEELGDDFKETPIYEEETESEELDLDTYDNDVDDYLDDFVDERDIGDEEDAYGDEAL